MIKNKIVNWEIGSEFHWMSYPKGSYILWPEPCLWYATGRDILLAICDHSRECHSKTVFVPDYFCPEVLSCWIKCGIRLRSYVDNPLMPYPDWDSIDCLPGDIVLAVNFFGVRDGIFWKKWKSKNKEVVLVEDHTHDPFSGWAMNSVADYAFASIRKICPVPDGALLWSPQKKILPVSSVKNEWSGSAYKLAAMILKRDFLEQQTLSLSIKETYRDFQKKGEELYLNSRGISMSPWSRFLTADGYPREWRVQREKNVRCFLEIFKKRASFINFIFNSWPKDHCPFNIVLFLLSENIRDGLRNKLIKSNIYSEVNWVKNKFSSSKSIDISKRILTIPVDHRYSIDDIERIAVKIIDILG